MIISWVDLGVCFWSVVLAMVLGFVIKKEHPIFLGIGCFMKKWRRPTFPRLTAVSSALRGLTSLFEMGRGGPPRCSHHQYLNDNEAKEKQQYVYIVLRRASGRMESYG